MSWTRTSKKSRKEKQEAEEPDLKRENEEIARNKEKPEASRPHDFVPAEWTHPNGHPRCLLCGGEERVGGRCNVEPSKQDFADFEKELDAEFPNRHAGKPPSTDHAITTGPAKKDGEKGWRPPRQGS